MLWSDPRDEPPKELRETQAMMRRASRLLAAAIIAVGLLAVLGLLQ
ncbi:morphogenic membrane protein MmpB [Streptomyces boninensis]